MTFRTEQGLFRWSSCLYCSCWPLATLVQPCTLSIVGSSSVGPLLQSVWHRDLKSSNVLLAHQIVEDGYGRRSRKRVIKVPLLKLPSLKIGEQACARQGLYAPRQGLYVQSLPTRWQSSNSIYDNINHSNYRHGRVMPASYQAWLCIHRGGGASFTSQFNEYHRDIADIILVTWMTLGKSAVIVDR